MSIVGETNDWKVVHEHSDFQRPDQPPNLRARNKDGKGVGTHRGVGCAQPGS
jgi:hypothetical protein